MYCVKCGTQLPDHANFCFKCGVPQKGGVPAAASSNRVVEIQMGYVEESGFLGKKMRHVFKAVDIGSGNVVAQSATFRADRYLDDSSQVRYRESYEAKQILQSLMSELSRKGWSPEPRKGEFWYSYFLRGG